MARTKCKKQTKHGLKRVAERCNIANESNASSFVRSASIHGYSPNHIPEGNLKNYLIGKWSGKKKRVKIYKGYIFIFNNTSNRLITVYPIPDNLIEEFELFMSTRNYLNYK